MSWCKRLKRNKDGTLLGLLPKDEIKKSRILIIIESIHSIILNTIFILYWLGVIGLLIFCILSLYVLLPTL